jgi:hypothetical protein
VLAWELGTAIALARLPSTDGQFGHTRHMLARVHTRFPEGIETTDLKRLSVA